MDVAVLVRCYEERPLAAHVVDGHGDVCLAYLLELSTTRLPCPKLDASVPAPRYNDWLVLRIHEAKNILDWTCVLTDHRNLLRLQIELFYRVVGASE